ncbi:MAG: hypothetical protein JSS82_12175 [Bacteroidetes bacterium]|nr:hypothetical protein [Bacteroidota bacterium]
MELKLESRLEFGDKCSLSVNAYYGLVHAFYGPEANNVLAAMRPGLNVKLFPGFWIGIEELLFYNDNFPDEANHLHYSTEQKCSLRYYWDGVHRNRQSPHGEN